MALPHHSIILCLTSTGHGAAAWIMCRSDDTSYLARVSSGRASRRWNWVGTMWERGHPVLLDELEHLLGDPLVHEHDGVAEVDGGAREAHHGGVVERRAHDVDVVVLGLDAEQEQDAGQAEGRLLGG